MGARQTARSDELQVCRTHMHSICDGEASADLQRGEEHDQGTHTPVTQSVLRVLDSREKYWWQVPRASGDD